MKFRTGIKVSILVLAGIIVGLGLSISLNNNRSSLAENNRVPLETREELNRISSAFSDLAASVSPSVVNIATTKIAPRKQQPMYDFYDHPFFRRFFDEPGLPETPPEERRTSALGSGVIVSGNGHILTNNHVIDAAEEIIVTLHDKRTFTAELIGADPKTDLALIKIEAIDLPALALNDEYDLQAGELVVAVGIPFGLSHTVTMGIVSAVGRSNVGIVDYEDFIQTDAAINPGNSGGALVNSGGDLIGINTAIFSTSGGNMGVGFAIPARMAKAVMESLLEHGKVIRGWLGVSIQDITPQLAEYFDLKKQHGALISGVLQDSPAAEAGLRQRDIVVSFNGAAVESSADLKNQVAATAPGTEVTLTVIRDQERVEVEVVLGELQPEKSAPEFKTGESADPGNFFGAHLQELDDELKQQLMIPEKVHGVLVAGVEADTPAAEVLRAKDVIMEINREEIRGLEDVKSVSSGLGSDDNILLLIFRGGGSLYVTLKL